MSIRNLDFLFRPRSVAVIGASERAHSVGSAVMRNLLDGGFPGPIFPVHHTRQSVAGVHAYRDVGFLPQVPDLAIICTPPDTVAGLVRLLGAQGVRAVAVLTDGVPHQALLEAARQRLTRVLGPNSMGFIAPALRLNASFAPVPASPGALAIVSQSGALLAAALDWAATHGIGFTYAVSLGDAADVDAGDVIDYLGGDPATRGILLYLESVRSGRKFLSAARAAARAKPVIVLKAGRTPEGAELARRHTEADPGADDAFDAAVSRAGMVRVSSIAELFEAAQVIGRMSVAAGAKLAMLTNAGGPAVVAADELVARGGEVASSTDLGGDADPGRYAAALREALAKSAPDPLLLIHGPTGVTTPEEVAQACTDQARDSGRVLACWLGGERARSGAALLRAAGVPVYDMPEAAVRAFLHVRAHQRNQEALQESPSSASSGFEPDDAAVEAVIGRALDAGRERLTDPEGKALLVAYGVPVADAHVRDGARELTLRAAPDVAFGMLIRLDGAVGIAPLNEALARGMLPRDAPGAQATAVLLARVSRLIARHPQIVELEIDPLLVDAQGAMALETRIRVERTRLAPGEHLAIRPYPSALESRVDLGGASILLRPVRPGDARGYAEFIAATQAPDLQFRFFSRSRRVSASDLAGFTQIDYDREMAFVAVAPDGPDILGEVRIIHLDGETAEFAILVRSDMKRRGLGRALTQKAVDYARSRGTRWLIAQIDAANEPMIALARRIGMEVERAPESKLAVAHLDLHPTSPQVKLF